MCVARFGAKSHGLWSQEHIPRLSLKEAGYEIQPGLNPARSPAGAIRLCLPPGIPGSPPGPALTSSRHVDYFSVRFLASRGPKAME